MKETLNSSFYLLLPSVISYISILHLTSATCRETLYKKSLCMGQALIKVSHKNKGSINLGDPALFYSRIICEDIYLTF